VASLKLPSLHNAESLVEHPRMKRFGISKERIIELSEAGYIPHYNVDGKMFFEPGAVSDYVSSELMTEAGGASFPRTLTVVQPPPNIAPGALPESITYMEHQLKEFLDINYPPCVYFLISRDEVVYIGQSVQLVGRIAQHRASSSGEAAKVFDRVVWLPVPRSELLPLERAFIDTIKPRLNRVWHGSIERREDENKELIQGFIRPKGDQGHSEPSSPSPQSDRPVETERE